ncbi:hypothetical protein JKP88DRAFT_247782 [Tribonema minus]|uniref:Uncharacterized protein n=1 Tax=Tribonema minus TaxID=303371 RepID=A0A835YXK5_9STRA|nr:hypothetical protein JKP88DRAFT_247782 [Tribonema minus]
MSQAAFMDVVQGYREQRALLEKLFDDVQQDGERFSQQLDGMRRDFDRLMVVCLRNMDCEELVPDFTRPPRAGASATVAESVAVYCGLIEYGAKRQAADARARLEDQRDRGMGKRRRRMKAEFEAREHKLAAAAADPGGGAQRAGSGSSAKSIMDRLKDEQRARREAAAAQAARDAAVASSGAHQQLHSEAGAELDAEER